MLKKILIVLSLLIVNGYGGEATLEKAQHRLPPVIFSIDIPKTVKPNQDYDFKWTVMGYHDAYDIILNVYDKNSKKIASKKVSSYDETEGQYSWGDIKSRKFFYETQMNLDFTGSQELTIRFFASPPNDYINTDFLSCLVPGGSGYKAGDTTGRKILIDGVDEDTNDIKIKSVKATPLSGKSYAETGEEINFKVLTKGDNIKVYIHFFDGYKYLPKNEMSGGNGIWTFTRAIKNAGHRKYKITIEDLSGTVLKTHEAYIDVKKVSTSYKKLDVPYLYQRDVPYIGKSACASASSAMILAYYGKIEKTKNSMIEATKKVFKLTGSSVSEGLQGRHTLVNTLKNSYGFSYVKFEEPLYEPLYKIIKDEINAERPLILGSRYSMVNGGHYMVVIGYDGETYDDAKLIINDPEGKWLGKIGKYQLGKGQGVKYDFTDITSQYSDGVFVIRN